MPPPIPNRPVEPIHRPTDSVMSDASIPDLIRAIPPARGTIRSASSSDATHTRSGSTPIDPSPFVRASPPLPFSARTTHSAQPSQTGLDDPPGYSNSTSGAGTPSASTGDVADASTLPDLAKVRASLLSSWEDQRKEAENIRARLLQRKENLIRGMSGRTEDGASEADPSLRSPPPARSGTRPSVIASQVCRALPACLYHLSRLWMYPRSYSCRLVAHQPHALEVMDWMKLCHLWILMMMGVLLPI
jgi:hypothetical protein